MDWLLIVLIIGATYRLTRLITADYLTVKLRDWMEKFGDYPTYFIHCDWCVSLWVAVPVSWVAVEHYAQTWVQVLLILLTASAVTGQLASREAE